MCLGVNKKTRSWYLDASALCESFSVEDPVWGPIEKCLTLLHPSPASSFATNIRLRPTQLGKEGHYRNHTTKSQCQLSRFSPHCPQLPTYRNLSKLVIFCLGLEIRNGRFWFSHLKEAGEIIHLSHKSAGFADVCGLQTTHQAMPKDADLVGLGDIEHLFSLEPAE